MAGRIFLLLIAVGAIWALTVGLTSLADADPENVRNLLVVVGSFLILAYLLVPSMLGVSDPLDPHAFSLFGLHGTKLAGGLVVASFISIPSLALVVLAAASVAAWARTPGVTVVAVLSGLLGVLTCLLVARLSEQIAGGELVSRRSRELRAVFLVLILVLIAPAIIFVLGIDWSNGSGFSEFGRAADVVSWTPFGAVWSAPGDAATGHVGQAVAKLFISLATVALLGLIWWRVVEHALRTRLRSIPAGSFGSLGWFDALPTKPAAAIAARSLSYWGRDARYVVSIIIIPILPFLLIPPLIIAGVPAEPLALIPVPVMALFLGWSLHNDVAFDSTAVWLHVASGVSGYSDRLGRTVPTLLIGVPLVVIGSMISIAYFGDWGLLPAMFGLAGCLLLSGVGVSSYLSVRHPYPAAAPGDSPFQQPQYSGSGGGFSQMFGLLLPVLLSLPAAYFGWGALTGQESAAQMALLVGLGTGIVVWGAGIWAGGYAFNRRGPEIMAFAASL